MLLRVLVAVALAGGIHEARAQLQSQCGDGECPPSDAALVRSITGIGRAQLQFQCGDSQCPQPVSAHSGPDTAPVGLIAGILGAIGVVSAISPNPPPPTQSAPSPAPSQAGPTLPATCNLPPLEERRYDRTHIIYDIPATVSAQVLDEIAARLNMTRIETANLRLTGRTLHVWRIDDGTPVMNKMRTACLTEPLIAGAQPNYLYALAQDQQETVNPDQYAPQKLKLPDAHRLATGNRVLVAIIDSGVDASHPDLADAIVANYDATNDDTTPHSHGTGMAGAIAARRTVLSSAPRVGLLTVRAFSTKAASAEGTTFNIIKGLDWAAEQGARVINLSFAGPPDPRLRDALAKAAKRNIVLVGAAGNAGPRSPPLYPGADPSVIAVTATDADDGLFPAANRGSYIALAAPGVDILVPAPEGIYQFTTGTSVAAAEVSGVVALLIERNPSLTPAEVRRILIRTAKALGPKARGYGLVNALDAVTAAKPR